MNAQIDAPRETQAPPGCAYRLRAEGQLDELAFDYVDDLTLALEFVPTKRTITTLTCELANQEALVGLINLLHDFGLRLVLVERLDPSPLTSE